MLLELYLGPCKTSGIDIDFYEIVEGIYTFRSPLISMFRTNLG